MSKQTVIGYDKELDEKVTSLLEAHRIGKLDDLMKLDQIPHKYCQSCRKVIPAHVKFCSVNCKERFEKQLAEIKQNIMIEDTIMERLRKDPEVQLQNIMFKTWLAIGGINYPTSAPQPYMQWCPKCKKWEILSFKCGLSVPDAIELLKKEMNKHSDVVGVIQKRIRKEVEKDFNQISSEEFGDVPPAEGRHKHEAS